MPQYLTQFAYTPQAWAALIANPVDRSEQLRAVVERLGGRLVTFAYTLGEWDGMTITEAPDETSAVAAVLAAIAPGHLRATKTTALLTPAEMMEAMRRAKGIAYSAPSA